jgi:outer membrane protein assembly factor BamB
MSRETLAGIIAALTLISACSEAPAPESSAATSSSGTGVGGASTTSSTGNVSASTTTGSGTGGYPAPVPDQATTYQINAAHAGDQPDDTLTPPLMQRWTLDLHGAISYPLIAGGRVFVTVTNADAQMVPLPGSRLFALEQATGKTVWGPVDLGGKGMSLAAYDDGQVFTVNSEGVTRSFDAATGKEGWSLDLAGIPVFTSPPVATMGKVFVVGGKHLSVIAQATGKLMWTREVQGTEYSAPIVSATAAFVAVPGSCVESLELVKGFPNWQLYDCHAVTEGRTPALFDGTLYVRNPISVSSTNLVLDAATGAQTGTFEADVVPAFHDKRGFFLSQGALSAKDLPAQTEAWSFKGDGMLASAPIVVNGHVYIGGSVGMLYALDEHTGKTVWSTDVGTPILAPFESNQSPTIAGLAAGGGALIVPAWQHLAAYW